MKNNWIRAVGDAVTYVWDWPVVEGNNFSDTQRTSIRGLQEYFSTVCGIGSAAFACAAGGSVPDVVASSAAGVVGGHYLGGMTYMLGRKPK
ncbi:MAG: hypothetical protein WC043_01100 [Pseudobdellovibrionaceae bacterium]